MTSNTPLMTRPEGKGGGQDEGKGKWEKEEGGGKRKGGKRV